MLICLERENDRPDWIGVPQDGATVPSGSNRVFACRGIAHRGISVRILWTLSGVKRWQGEVSNYKQTANTESFNFWVYMRCSLLFKLLVEYLQYLVPQNTWRKCNVLIPFWPAGGATVLGRQPHGVRSRDRHRRDSVFLHNAHDV